MSFGAFKPAGSTGSTTGFGGFGAAAQPAASTSTSSPFGSFGQQQQAQPASGGLFGSQNQASTSGTTSGLFGNTQQQGGSSLFGQNQNQNQQNTGAGGGLFGQQQNAGASGGLFGSVGAKPAAPSGGLFGQNAGTTGTTGGLFGQQQNTNTGSTGGLFGQQQQQPSTGGLFGQQNQQNQNQQQQGSSLFGAKPGGHFGQQSTTQPSGGLFGQQSTSQPSGGLFGQQSTTQPSGLFGQQSQQQPGLFGQQQQQQGPSKSTKFSDLPEPAQKVVEQLDAWIKDQKSIGARISTEHIGRAIWQTSGDVKAAADEEAAISQSLAGLKSSLEALAGRVQTETADLQKLLETWEAAKPVDARHGAVRPVAHRDFPQEYFQRVAEGLNERVHRYKRTITLLTRAVTSLANEQQSLSPQVVVETIQNNQAAILALAAQLETLELRMNGLRAEFVEQYRERTSSMRDPFDVAREERGISLLRA